MKLDYIKKAAIANYSYVKRFQMDTLSKTVKKAVEDISLKEKIYDNEVRFADRKRIGFWHRVEGILFEDHLTTYVVFMATNDWQDWITNFNFFKKSIPFKTNKKTKVHGGYLDRYILDKVRTKILLYVANSNKKNIIVTGYSMGGGLAPICALDLVNNFKDKTVHCVAMAGPRIGNKHFVEEIEKKCDVINFIYGNDIVTKVPLKLFGFKHINKKHYGPERKWWKLSIKHHIPNNLFNEVFENAKGV